MLVHRSDDFPDDTAIEKALPVGRELLFRVTPTSAYCTEAVRQVAPSIRECVFESEGKLKYFPVYSEINCITECRMDYTIHYCNCSHFYYHDTGKYHNLSCLYVCCPPYVLITVLMWLSRQIRGVTWTETDCSTTGNSFWLYNFPFRFLYTNMIYYFVL